MQTRTTKGTDGASDVFQFGTAQSQTILDAQKEFLDAIDRSSRAWLDRVKSEAELWSELSTKLAQTRSMAESVDAYQQFISQRIQMAADDGYRLFDEYQAMMRTCRMPFWKSDLHGRT